MLLKLDLFTNIGLIVTLADRVYFTFHHTDNFNLFGLLDHLVGCWDFRWVKVIFLERIKRERMRRGLPKEEHDCFCSWVIDVETLCSLNKEIFTSLTDNFSTRISRLSLYLLWQLTRLYFYGRPTLISVI